MSSTTIDVPPGLEPATFAKVVASGGAKPSEPWLPYQGKAVFQNIIPVDEKEGKVLLAWKDSGFGRKKYNPFAGPINGDSTKTAIKDLKAQSGLEAIDVAKIGKIIVVLEGNPIALDVDMYRATSWKGEAVDKPEFDIRPTWFASPTSSGKSALPPIPFDQMFADDIHWLPLLTSGKFFIGRADFGASEDKFDVGVLRKFWFAIV